jgi:hypothetical protein
MMIIKFAIRDLRFAEHFQFISDICKIFKKHGLELQFFAPLYNKLFKLCKDEQKSMAMERVNAKIKEKSNADDIRDKLHSKLFTAVKVFLYDETDPYFAVAQQIMDVIKSLGNPRNLGENAETAMITTLGNKLKPYRIDMKMIGVQAHLDKLLEANSIFAQLETECRDITSAHSIANIPPVSTVRKQVDPAYHDLINAFNTFIKLNGEERYLPLVTDINTLIEKYETLLAQRKGRKKNESEEEKNG